LYQWEYGGAVGTCPSNIRRRGQAALASSPHASRRGLRELGLGRGPSSRVPGNEQVSYFHKNRDKARWPERLNAVIMLNAWIMDNVRGDCTNAARQQDA
jgi:hypothetical protein